MVAGVSLGLAVWKFLWLLRFREERTAGFGVTVAPLCQLWASDS